MICFAGSWPRHHATKATETVWDLRCRGGKFTTSRRQRPRRTSSSFAAITSRCQLGARRVWAAISAWARALNATKSRRRISRYRRAVGSSGFIVMFQEKKKVHHGGTEKKGGHGEEWLRAFARENELLFFSLFLRA